MSWRILVPFSYALVGALSVGLAFWLATGMIKRGYSQQPVDSVPAEATVAPEPPAQVPSTPPDSGIAPSPQPGPEGAAAPVAGAPGSVSPQNQQLKEEIQSFLEPFIYDAEGRRDPYFPFEGAEVGGSGLGPLLPLQRFDLNEIRLISIIWGVVKPKAMFLDPTNQVHVLEKDQRIGRNNGYVAVIREGEVVVVETTMIRGELTYTTRIMKIER